MCPDANEKCYHAKSNYAVDECNKSLVDYMFERMICIRILTLLVIQGIYIFV